MRLIILNKKKEARYKKDVHSGPTAKMENPANMCTLMKLAKTFLNAN